jgi:hypothetical protein
VVQKHCQSLEFFEVIQGDSLVLVDRTPFNLISAIKKIAYDLWTGPYKVKLRVGCDYGIMVPMYAPTGGVKERGELFSRARRDRVGAPEISW